MIAAKLAMAKMARALVVDRNAWIAGGALIIVAIVVYAIATRKEGYAAYSPTKYPHWGWGANKGLRCKNNNNTGCTTKWEGGRLVDLETPSAPAPTGQGKGFAILEDIKKKKAAAAAASSAKKKDGESCEGGNQCQSGLCSSGKKCYSVGCPKTGATVWHPKTRKCLWPCGSGKERNDKGECVSKSGFAIVEDIKKRKAAKCKWFQTVDAKGKCVGCPPQRPHWDGKNCVAKDGSTGKNCQWFQKLDSRGRCVGCPPDKPHWDGKNCVVKPTSATLDVVRKYPYWGEKGTRYEGLKCKGPKNDRCTTKWVNNRLVDLEKPGDVCPHAWQTKNEKGRCVGCPPDKPHWNGKTCVAKTASGQACQWFQRLDAKGKCAGCPPDKPHWDGKACIATTTGCQFAWQVRDWKGRCVGCPPDKPHWDGKSCVAKTATGCPFAWQTKNAKGQCVGCPPDKPIWDGKSNSCVASTTPSAAPVPNLASIPAAVPALDCKAPKHWQNDQCVCIDGDKKDGADGSWCTVSKAQESWDWRKKQCAQVGGYVCSEKKVKWDDKNNINYKDADVPNQCCVDTEYDCGGGGIKTFFKNLGQAGARTSEAWNDDNEGCNVDVYRATDLAPLGVNNFCGGLGGVVSEVIPPSRVLTLGVNVGRRIYDELTQGDTCTPYKNLDMDPPQEFPNATDLY